MNGRSTMTVVIVALIGGVAGSLATQVFSGTPAAAVRTLPADLGPADGLILAGKDGALTARNEGMRISWGENPGSRAYSVGCVHIDKIMKALLASERFAADRQKFDEEARSQGEEFEKRSKDLQAKYPEAKPTDPNFEEAKKEFVVLQSEYERWLASIQKIQSKHMAEQIEKAYRDLSDALEIVADRKSIDFVYRFVPPSNPFGSTDLADAMMQVQARPFLRYPASTDITEDVVKELGLPAN